MKKKIIIKFNGGFGNHLFQYCFGQYVSKTYTVDVVYDASELNITDLKTVVSKPLKLAAKSDLFKCGFIGLKSVDMWLKRIYKRQSLVNNYYYEFHSSDSVISFIEQFMLKGERNLYLDGYWQNIIYLKGYSSLFSTFDPKKFVSDKNVQIINNLIRNDSVALHIRLGDYIDDPKFSAIYRQLDVNYYINALSKFENIKKVYVISNDIVKAEKIFNLKGVNILYVNSNSAIEDFSLMTLSSNNIIANSTFSWWAAYMGENHKNKVVAPRDWFMDEKKNNNARIHCEHWVLI